ncbi:MAG: hypothetical protein JSR46_00435 [Verrucomicrobia bacterium]|nr:hypothetical protein [Verrucomicrobiota bacterium]
MYLDELEIEFEARAGSIADTISYAKKLKATRAIQALKNCCAPELREVLHDTRAASLVKELQSDETSYRKVLFALREALEQPTYHFLKQDHKHPLIRFLHTLCLASYAGAPLVDCYKQIGDHLADLTCQELIQEGTRFPFHQFLAASRTVAKKAGLIDNDYTLWYALNHPRELISAITSKSWGRGLSYFKKFDPKGFAGNIPGAFFEEELTFRDHSTKVVARTIYSPTPSLGEGIVPEAKAMLQAMENHHSLAPDELQNEQCPYLAWVYVNLQNLTSSHERRRSLSLMRLTEQYPHSFFAITVTQDAGLYSEKNASHMLERMQQSLLDDDNFTLEGGKNGYCFPCRTDTEKEQWKEVLTRITELAFNLMDDANNSVVFCELVTLAIVRYFHLRCGLSLAQLRPRDEQISYLVTSACKESIDRGGKINALLLLGKGRREPEVLKAAFSCFHARALSVRERLIKKERMMQACALLSVVPHDRLQQFLNKIDALVHLSRSEVNVLW